MGIVKVPCGFNHSLAVVSGKQNKYDRKDVLPRQLNSSGAPVSSINPTNS